MLPAAVPHGQGLVPAPPPGDAVTAWVADLDLGSEPDAQGCLTTVYLVTFARVLGSTLARAPQLQDPSTFTCESKVFASRNTLSD